jgi:hypothetical protein
LQAALPPNTLEGEEVELVCRRVVLLGMMIATLLGPAPDASIVGASLATARTGSPTAYGSESAAATPQSARQAPGGNGWNAKATSFRGQNGAHFVYTCPKYGTAYTVYGTDVYTDDTSVCTAAVHAGRITLAGGGSVTIEIRPGQSSYTGSTRNGITSSSYGSWAGSYVIVDATPVNPGVGAGGSGWNADASAYVTFIGAQFAYTCPANGTPGSVWGTDVYTTDSRVCTAAVHAGRITLAGGGSVTIEIRPGQSSYTGSTRNGITSSSYGPYRGSYVFVGAPSGGGGGGGGGTPAPATGTPTGTVLVDGSPFTGGTIPYGSSVDVTNGKLDMSTEAGPVTVFGGGGGVTSKFRLVRASSKKPSLVELRLIGGDFSACRKLARAGGQMKAKSVRRLWSKGKGLFRTQARFSSASVQGTFWLTDDRCDGSWTSVKQGVVTVHDFTKNKTVRLHAGQGYLAKPK